MASPTTIGAEIRLDEGVEVDRTVLRQRRRGSAVGGPSESEQCAARQRPGCVSFARRHRPHAILRAGSRSDLHGGSRAHGEAIARRGRPGQRRPLHARHARARRPDAAAPARRPTRAHAEEEARAAELEERSWPRSGPRTATPAATATRASRGADPASPHPRARAAEEYAYVRATCRIARSAAILLAVLRARRPDERHRTDVPRARSPSGSAASTASGAIRRSQRSCPPSRVAIDAVRHWTVEAGPPARRLKRRSDTCGFTATRRRRGTAVDPRAQPGTDPRSAPRCDHRGMPRTPARRSRRQARAPLQAAARAAAARRPDAAADARGVRRPGAPRRRARSAPPERRPRPPRVDPAVGPARHRQDEPCAAARRGGRRRLRDAVGGHVRRRRRPGDDRRAPGSGSR